LNHLNQELILRGLGSGLDDIGVKLDLSGNAHVDVFVANGNDQATNDAGVHTRGDLQGLVALQEGLKGRGQ